MKNIKRLKVSPISERFNDIVSLLPIWGRFLYYFYQLTPKQKIYIIKTIKNVKKYNL